MYTLGVSYGFHDAAAALASGGRIIAMATEDRFSRQKHDEHFPAQAIAFCLEKAGITVADLSQVVYHESPAGTFSRVLASTLAEFPRSRREFTAAMKTWFGKKLWVENALSRRIGVEPRRIRCLDHHLSHGAQAFLGSGWDEAAILTIDAAGEWASTSLAVGRRRGAGVAIDRLHEIDYPHSLGLVYSAFTAFLGFLPMDGECSTMALAAFGTPRYAEAIRKMVRPTADGGYAVDGRYFNFNRFFAEPWTRALVEALGPPRSPHAPLPFACLAPWSSAPDAEHYADVAASIQLVHEETVLRLAGRLARESGLPRLCLAGGAALNCVANARLLKEGAFAELYIPPDPGDGGAAAGAALYGDVTGHGAHGGAASPASRPTPAYSVYVGPSESTAKILDMLPHIDPRAFRRHLQPGLASRRGGERWDARRVTDPEELVREVAAALAAGRIVGWCQGPAESGPRALGARSLLIRPDDLSLARRLSADVKDRAAYRPYALSMTEAAARRLLVDGERLKVSTLHRWMQTACPVRAELRPRVAAGLHVDGTTRPQIVGAADHPRFHALLEAFAAHAGLACLVNTSFNDSGAPLVSTPLEALAAFARTGMDLLVFDELIVRKIG